MPLLKQTRDVYAHVTLVLTLATVSPIGHGRCGDRVAKTPILPPFNLGTLTYPSSQPFIQVKKDIEETIISMNHC